MVRGADGELEHLNVAFPLDGLGFGDSCLGDWA